MGRPRGKSKKAIEAASNDDEDGSGGEEAPPTPKRRGRPQTKPLKDDADEAEDKDTAEAEEDDADGTKPVVRPSKDSTKQSSAEGGGKKRRRRREEEEGHVRSSKSNGFRPNGSRRKSTPRRAAEAGVECK
ncbi:hypothetical protein SEVIR_6G212700v4 [Setaria viridis]|uniref:Uncharacterized protein n=2 Tax=Setaria TaxID=4554 RepID=Q7XBG3_SETIT|nr:uncharacterized protein LOC101780043 [Setaria italica]XP_034599204.1 FACT complex subunit POB3 [Setaria viridis]AAP93139.1 unknown [Setaria italica]RCV31784.1 hypothetical protein SETIT_6G205600v2 [Setaria italica]TKW11119.1 hypothetical protein SEVIR_6G212700v2 [Setaria viridis]